MKILFVGSGCAGRLPFAERLFKKTLQEEDLQGDVQVAKAVVDEWGVSSDAAEGQSVATAEKVGDLLSQADFIVVMEERQRSFLTRFMDYASWGKIHLFGDYCKCSVDAQDTPACGNLSYRTQGEEMRDGCRRMIHRLKEFLRGTLTSEQAIMKPAEV